jgi:hypothetical protein
VEEKNGRRVRALEHKSFAADHDAVGSEAPPSERERGERFDAAFAKRRPDDEKHDERAEQHQ